MGGSFCTILDQLILSITCSLKKRTLEESPHRGPHSQRANTTSKTMIWQASFCKSVEKSCNKPWHRSPMYLLEVSSSYGSAVSQTYINVTRNAIRSFFGSGLFLKIPTFKIYSSKLLNFMQNMNFRFQILRFCKLKIKILNGVLLIYGSVSAIE